MTATVQAKTASGELWTIAALRVTRETIERHGYGLGRGYDDLDSFTVVELFDGGIGYLYLLNRDHVPADVFDVMVDAAISRDRGLQAMQRIFPADACDYEWISSFPVFQVPGPAVDDPSDNYRETDSGPVANVSRHR